MECKKVKDRFSSYLEKELTPSEEKEIQEHLRSCAECQKEFEEFGKTVQWLHSVGEVEVPDPFNSELYQILEERKKRTSAERSMKWLGIPLPFKLPVQAVAMVFVVFSVLTLARMMPRSPSSLPVEKKQTFTLQPDTSASRSTRRPSDSAHGPQIPEQAARSSAEQLPAWQAHREEKSQGTSRRAEGLAEKEPGASEETPGAARLHDVKEDKTQTMREEKFEPTVSGRKTEAQKTEGSAPNDEAMASRPTEPRKAEGAKALSPGSKPYLGKSVSKEKSFSAAKSPKEIILRISDREKAASQICKLVEQFKGEVITQERDRLLASLPASSFSEFEKKLTALNFPDEPFVEKPDTGDRTAEPKAKKKSVEGQGQSAPLANEKEDRIILHILLVQE